MFARPFVSVMSAAELTLTLPVLPVSWTRALMLTDWAVELRVTEPEAALPVMLLLTLTLPVVEVRVTDPAVIVPELVTSPVLLVTAKVEPVLEALVVPPMFTPELLLSVTATVELELAIRLAAFVAPTLMPPAPADRVKVVVDRLPPVAVEMPPLEAIRVIELVAERPALVDRVMLPAVESKVILAARIWPKPVSVIVLAAVTLTELFPLTLLLRVTPPLFEVKLIVPPEMVPPVLVMLPPVLVKVKVEAAPAFEVPAILTEPVSEMETLPEEVAVRAPALVEATLVPPVPEASTSV